MPMLRACIPSSYPSPTQTVCSHRYTSLTSLEILNLSSNDLSGTLPTEWGSFTNLGQLLLGDNQLTGALPDSCA